MRSTRQIEHVFACVCVCVSARASPSCDHHLPQGSRLLLLVLSVGCGHERWHGTLDQTAYLSLSLSLSYVQTWPDAQSEAVTRTTRCDMLKCLYTPACLCACLRTRTLEATGTFFCILSFVPLVLLVPVHFFILALICSRTCSFFFILVLVSLVLLFGNFVTISMRSHNVHISVYSCVPVLHASPFCIILAPGLARCHQR
ncbi:unnamed protein product [Protopolystoma xenopodis]|uniref:Uncharacterized protein n=1 Tax=Protopolystoma xenopodis TaxID=117903 RepID=A0A448XBD5_9PLAT|nr:unnamed protein product [Protopolystoma xenopodis]